MENDWALIYSTGQLYQAEMVKDIIENNDMAAVIINKQDSFYLFGDIEVYVKPDDVIRAKFLLKEL